MIFSSDYFEQLVRALVAYQKGQQGRSLKSIVGQAQRHQEAERLARRAFLGLEDGGPGVEVSAQGTRTVALLFVAGFHPFGI